jgi:transposase
MRAKRSGIWEKIMKAFVETSRVNMGRNAQPSHSLIDSQSVKTTGKAIDRGIDGGKKN